MKMKNFSKTLLVIMIGTMGFSSCADSWEEMRKEKYEKEWVKTFGEVDPNHTWNLATQVTADLAIKEDALTEYTFKVYTSDPIWGTDAKLLAKATVKTDEVGYAETQIKFDAPSSQERYYITRTDRHGRRLLKVSDIENKKIGVKFGISNYSAESRSIVEEFPTYTFPYDINEMIKDATDVTETINNNPITNRLEIANYITNENKTAIINGDITINNVCFAKWDNYIYKIIINGDVTLNIENEHQLNCFEFIILPNKSLTITGKTLTMMNNAKIFVMANARLIGNNGTGFGEKASICLDQNQDNQQCIIYNEGRIELKYLGVKRGDIFNMGTGVMVIEKSIDFQNYEDKGTLTNYGRIKTKTLEGNGQSNSGSNDNKFALAGQQGTVNTACFLYVEDKINIKYLNIGTNTAVESDTVVVNDLSLRASSILRTEHFAAQNATWQFVGNNDTDRALISANIIEYLMNGGTTIHGPIYIETDSLSLEWPDREEILNSTTVNNGFTPGWGEIGSAPFLIIPDGFYDEEHDDISKADCVGHGNIPKEFEKIVDKSIEWVVAFEDLGSTGDYDFNDAVLGISHDKENNKITVTPLAAGGTMHAKIFYNSEDLGEIHNLLGNDATNVPINVNNRGSEGTETEISVGENFSITKDWTNFSIQVNGKSGTVYKINPNKEAGDAPQAICMPAPWFWAKEGINIHDAYIQFGGWVTDQETYQKWHQNPTKEKVAL